MTKTNPYSCPICNARPAFFYQYPMICGKCWTVLKVFDTMQLQMRLIFWSSMKHDKPMIRGA